MPRKKTTCAQQGARIARRLLALAACIWYDQSVKTTGLRSLTGYDQ